MSNSQGNGGRPPPQDDRTLLDPLNAEELKALREARQRVQVQARGSAVAHHMVVGPDAGEDIGDAPTRATPSLPSFDGRGTSIDSIQTGSGPVDAVSARPVDPAMRAASQGASARAAEPAGAADGSGKPAAFGENTLLWMQPPKIVREATQSTAGIVTGDLLSKPHEVRMRRIKTAGLFAVLGTVAVALVLASRQSDRGVIELHSNPEKATVIIDGHPQSEVSPVKLTLPVGAHEIRLELEGHKPATLALDVKKSDEAERHEIDLEPISKPGLMTVAIAVQPVAARITVNGQEFLSKRKLMVPNLDPKKPHKIIVEAGGYVKVEQEIPADQLKGTYTFVMQRDGDGKPPQ